MEPATQKHELSAALAKVKELVPADLLTPIVAIICGSGLSTLGSAIKDAVVIPYTDLPGFLTSKGIGGPSELTHLRADGQSQEASGSNAGKSTQAHLRDKQLHSDFSAQFHAYEGHSQCQITFPITLFAELGCRNVILTNAAGSLNPDIAVGTIVAIHDHLSLPTLTAFPNSLQLPRPPYYSQALRKLLFQGAHALHLPADTLAEGTYCWVTGPTFETAAEGIFLRNAGGDVVGASTVPEVFAAREQGMEVLALSLVTNMVTMSRTSGVKEEVQAELAGLPIHAPSGGHVVSHSEVLEMGVAKAEIVKALVIAVVQSIP